MIARSELFNKVRKIEKSLKFNYFLRNLYKNDDIFYRHQTQLINFLKQDLIRYQRLLEKQIA